MRSSKRRNHRIREEGRYRMAETPRGGSVRLRIAPTLHRPFAGQGHAQKRVFEHRSHEMYSHATVQPGTAMTVKEMGLAAKPATLFAGRLDGTFFLRVKRCS